MKHLFIVVFLLFTSYCFSIQRQVPGNYSSIQSALNACSIGDTVMVQPGIYFENLNWPQVKNIKLFSAGDSSNTIIDANFYGRCITISGISQAVIDSNTVISGFKLRNGYSDTLTLNGVAVYATNASPVFKNLAITNCNVYAQNTPNGLFLNGGVVYLTERSIIRNCHFYKNTVYNSNGSINGGLISMQGSNSTPTVIYGHIYNTKIDHNTISVDGNSVYGGIISGNMNLNKLYVQSNTVTIGNTNPGELNGFIYANGGTQNSFGDLEQTIKSILITDNKFVSTAATVRTIGVYYNHYGGSCTVNRYYLDNATIANNKAVTSGMIISLSCYKNPAFPINCPGLYINMWAEIRNSVLYNPLNSVTNEFTGLGATNVTTINPLFVSSSDYHLQVTSTALSSGSLGATSPTTDIAFNSIPLPAGTLPDRGCYEMNQTTETLVVSANLSTATVCLGTQVSFTNTTPNSQTCLWTTLQVGNATNTPTYNFTPPASGSYTVNLIVLDSNNVSGLKSFVVTALAAPAVSVTSSSNTLCVGQSATLSATTNGSITSYLWYNGAGTSSVTVTPSVSANYSVVVQNSYGCSASASAYINVHSHPTTPTISCSNTTLCAGQSATLSTTTDSTVSSYLWSNGSISQNAVVAPTTTQTYSLSVQNIFGCAVSSNTINLVVFSAPIPTITSSSSYICVGQSFTFNVTSTTPVNSYLWFNGAATQSIVFTPSVSGTFTVQANNNNCSAIAGIYVNVYVCAGVKTNTSNYQVRIFPNPSQGRFVIENSDGILTNYEVSDMTGKLICEGAIEKPETEITIKNILPGLYSLKLKNLSSVTACKKLIIQ